MQASLNQFWGVVAKPSRSGILVFLTTRLVSLGVVLVIGFLLLTSLAMSIGIMAVIRYAESWIPIPPLLVTPST
jgi:membrane protein